MLDAQKEGYRMGEGLFQAVMTSNFASSACFTIYKLVEVWTNTRDEPHDVRTYSPGSLWIAVAQYNATWYGILQSCY